MDIITYNFKNKQLEFKNKLNEDLNHDEITLLNEIAELFKLVEFINKRRDTRILNILNHIYIETIKKDKDTYISLNFVRAPIENYKFYKYRNKKEAEIIVDISKVYYTKLINGKISRQSCIYKRLTSFITGLCDVTYKNETVDQFITLSEMNEV